MEAAYVNDKFGPLQTKTRPNSDLFIFDVIVLENEGFTRGNRESITV